MSAETVTTSSPRRRPAATFPATVLAVVLVLVGVVGVHDFLVDRGAVGGNPWVDKVVGDLDGLSPAWWTTTIAVVVVLVGLAMLWTALRPARRTHQESPLHDGDVWISKRAVRRLAEQAAARTTGVETASVDVRRRKIVVKVTAAGPSTGGDHREHVETNVRAALDGFSDLPVTVRSKEAQDVA